MKTHKFKYALENEDGDEDGDKGSTIRLWRRQFDNEVSTTEAAENVLFEKLSQAGLLYCRGCSLQDFSKSDGTRMVTCNWCKEKQSFTANTLFHGMRRAVIREYLFFIYLIENGIEVNASEFARNSSVAYSSSLMILRKCAMVLEQMMRQRETRSMHCVQLAEVVCRRSTETPAGEHPRSEQTALSKLGLRRTEVGIEEQESEREEDDALMKALPVEQQTLFGILGEQPTYFDALCERSGIATGLVTGSLMMLELAGWIECKGDMYWRKERQKRVEIEEETDSEPGLRQSAVEFIRRVYQGISQKYSQLYLALHWCFRDRKDWTGQLLQACLRSEPVTYRQVLGYKSPAVLRLSPVA
jgi:hypothetical protein